MERGEIDTIIAAAATVGSIQTVSPIVHGKSQEGAREQLVSSENTRPDRVAGLGPIQKMWFGEPEADKGSVSKRTTKVIFSIVETYLLNRRPSKYSSPIQIQSQKLEPNLARPNLYLDLS